MKILSFMNGYYSRSRIQVKSLALILFMMILQTNSHANQPLQALDTELLEFLSLYDAEDEELVDQVIEEESTYRHDTNQDTNNVSNIKQGAE